MKKQIVWVAMVCTLGSCYGQRSFELSFQGSNISSAAIGKMESPKVYEFGIGLGGNGGGQPYLVFNVGQSRFSYTDTLFGKQNFKGLVCGGIIGFRPFSKTHCTRFQPIIQVYMKKSLTGKSKNANGEPEPVFAEGESNPKLFKISFLGIGAGFEFFLTDGFSISSILSLDRVKFNASAENGLCLNLKLKYYIRY